MHSLSPLDGSADAVRNAAAGATAIDDPERLAVEREMDRVSNALSAQVTTLAQHMNGMLLVQAMLLTAYCGVLLAAWSLPLPGKRWLLTAVAGYALATLLLSHLGLRAQFARTGGLRKQLRSSEEVLERIAGRIPVLARGSVVSALGGAATSVLPWLLAAGWSVLILYALALPLPAESGLVGATRGADEGRAAVVTSGAPRQVRATPRKADAPVAPVASEPVATDSESALAAFLRRATAPSASEAAERVTP